MKITFPHNLSEAWSFCAREFDSMGTLPGASLTPALLRFLLITLPVTPVALIAWGILAAIGSDTTKAKDWVAFCQEHTAVALTEAFQIKPALAILRPDLIPFLATSEGMGNKDQHTVGRTIRVFLDSGLPKLNDVFEKKIDTSSSRLDYSDLKQQLLRDCNGGIIVLNGTRYGHTEEEQERFWNDLEKALQTAGLIEEEEKISFLQQCHQGALAPLEQNLQNNGWQVAGSHHATHSVAFTIILTQAQQCVTITKRASLAPFDRENPLAEYYPFTVPVTLSAAIDLKAKSGTYRHWWTMG